MRSTPEDQCILISAGGDFLNVCGRVNLDISVNHFSMSHEFIVVENLTLNVLIGCDFMYKFYVVIDFMNRFVSFVGSLTAAKLLNQSSELSETARTVNKCNFETVHGGSSSRKLAQCLQRCGRCSP